MTTTELVRADLPDLLMTAAQAISDAQAFGGSCRARIGLSVAASNLDTPPFARYGLPYRLEPLATDRAILLNRDYKPVGLGIPYGMWVDYEAFPQWHVAGDTLARLRAADAWITDPDHPPGYLFHDGCAPWHGAKALRAYARRLDNLIHALPAPRHWRTSLPLSATRARHHGPESPASARPGGSRTA